MSQLDGKVAIVTGGAGAIGSAVAAAMAAAGASVAIADVSRERAETTATEIRAAGGSAIALAVDVSDRDGVEALVAAAEQELGTPTVVFCSAGITSAGGPMGMLELSDEEWDRVLDVNVRGTFLVSQVVARRIVAAGLTGSIVTVASIGAYRPMLGAPAYHTSKAAVVGLTRALAVNLAHHGIRANGIAPGYIQTEMLDAFLDADRERMLLSRVPSARLGRPQDLAGAAVFLASDDSSYMTGEILHVDGGALVLGWTPARSAER